MKTKKLFIFTVLSLLMVMGAGGCSNDDKPDYGTSIFSGEYGKDGLWELYVTVNDESLDNYGYVRFDSKEMKDAYFRFVDVIPGEHRKEFKNIPLTATEEGFKFSIDYDRAGSKIIISGLLEFGKMTVNINM